VSMVRRRSTVRFRNGAQVNGLIRKDSSGSWLSVGTNGCHQGTESPARPLLTGPVRKESGMPGAARGSRIPSQPTDRSAGQARTGTGAVRSRACLDAPCDNSPGRTPEAHDGMVRRGQRQPGAVIMSAGRAPRIARPRSRPARRDRAGGHGDRGRDEPSGEGTRRGRGRRPVSGRHR